MRKQSAAPAEKQQQAEAKFVPLLSLDVRWKLKECWEGDWREGGRVKQRKMQPVCPFLSSVADESKRGFGRGGGGGGGGAPRAP